VACDGGQHNSCTDDSSAANSSIGCKAAVDWPRCCCFVCGRSYKGRMSGSANRHHGCERKSMRGTKSLVRLGCEIQILTYVGISTQDSADSRPNANVPSIGADNRCHNHHNLCGLHLHPPAPQRHHHHQQHISNTATSTAATSRACCSSNNINISISNKRLIISSINNRSISAVCHHHNSLLII
jgi:hypothetical protein